VGFLCSPEVVGPHAEAIAALPANPDALKQSRYYPLFEDALERGRSHPAIPEWASVVENLATRDSIYAFWKRLAALTDTATYSSIPEPDQAARRRLVISSLGSAEDQINARLSPGKLAAAWPWMLVVAGVALGFTFVLLRQRNALRRHVQEARNARREAAAYRTRMQDVKHAQRTLQNEIKALHDSVSEQEQ
jgi:hypothetical protein